MRARRAFVNVQQINFNIGETCICPRYESRLLRSSLKCVHSYFQPAVVSGFVSVFWDGGILGACESYVSLVLFRSFPFPQCRLFRIRMVSCRLRGLAYKGSAGSLGLTSRDLCVKTVRIPCCGGLRRRVSETPLMYGSTAVDLNSTCFPLWCWIPGFGYFLQDWRRVTVGGENCRQMFLLLSELFLMALWWCV